MAKSIVKFQGEGVAPRSFELVDSGTLLVQNANGTQAAAILDATGGATIDAEARTAINELLAACRALGIIAT